jgi:hypothetical protein
MGGDIMPIVSDLIVLAGASLAIIGAWVYFQRYQIVRPPIGVFNRNDVIWLMAGIIILPYLYLFLPIWLAGTLLGLATWSVLYTIWEPVLRARRAVWLVVLLNMGLDLIAVWWVGADHAAFVLINDLTVLLICIGISNLWVQGGIKARHVMVLAAFLTLYDVIATSILPLMHDMMLRLAPLPFAPTVVWGTGNELAGIGLGDLILAATFPVVMCKAFSRRAGLLALLLMPCVIAGLVLLQVMMSFKGVFPAMVFIGPTMILQYFFWQRYHKRERTMWQYYEQKAGLSQF